MLYILKEGQFIRRGSPVAPTEAGVYAYTKVCSFFHVTHKAICTSMLLDVDDFQCCHDENTR